jgi:hypothetical protein
MWEIGFGLNPISIMKTLPFALFVVVLWAIDTASITTMLDAGQPEGKKEELDLNTSFLITSIRNMIGGYFGGAQTGALWRSFLIPLSMVQRPIRPASILMGAIGILVGITYYPIALLSFPPLVWSVLLYGIFLPFLVVGMKNLRGFVNRMDMIFILLFMVVGVMFSPIITWTLSLAYEKLVKRNIP